MFERFTDRARKVFAYANWEAQRFHHPYLGSEHVLLGFVKEGTGTGATVLRDMGVDLEHLRIEVERRMTASPPPHGAARTPMTSSAKGVIEQAIAQARDLDHQYVGTEHLLLGLIAYTEGIASQVLTSFGVTLEAARAKLLEFFGQHRSEVSFRSHAMAVDRVARRLLRVTAALDAAEIPYAVVGGIAVAAWVGRVDAAATRATRDIDVLVQRTDVGRIEKAFARLGLKRGNQREPVRFFDPEEPSGQSGVDLVWAGECVRPAHSLPAPDITESERDPEGFLVIQLAALVRMKLTAFRDIDRVHVADMLGVGLITPEVRGALPPELRGRLEQVERSMSD